MAGLTLMLIVPSVSSADDGATAVPATQPTTRKANVITLTNVASDEIKKIIKSQKLAESAMLRVGAKADNGKFSYVLDITEKPAQADDIVESDNGIAVVVARKSSFYLQGTVIDFKDMATGRGFLFRNPNAVEK